MSSKFNMHIIVKEVTYNVSFVKHIPPKCDDSDIVFGETNVYNKEILILDSLYPTDTFSTIVHELTHAFIFEYGFNDIMFDEEDLCAFMGAYIGQIFEFANRILDNYHTTCNKNDTDKSVKGE